MQRLRRTKRKKVYLERVIEFKRQAMKRRGWGWGMGLGRALFRGTLDRIRWKESSWAFKNVEIDKQLNKYIKKNTHKYNSNDDDNYNNNVINSDIDNTNE